MEILECVKSTQVQHSRRVEMMIYISVLGEMGDEPDVSGIGEELLSSVSKKGDMHFFRNSMIEKLEKFQVNSKVMDRIFKSKNNLPFMG